MYISSSATSSTFDEASTKGKGTFAGLALRDGLVGLIVQPKCTFGAHAHIITYYYRNTSLDPILSKCLKTCMSDAKLQNGQMSLNRFRKRF